MKELDKVNGQLRAPVALPRKKGIGNRFNRMMGVPQSQSRRFEEKKISVPCQETKYGSLIVLLFAQLLQPTVLAPQATRS